MDAGNRLPCIGAAQIDPRTHHIGETAAERRDAGCDLIEDIDRLPRRIPGADHLAVAMGRRRAADQNAIAIANRAAVTGDRLPNAAAVYALPAGSIAYRRCGVDAGELGQVMAEIAR